jgi:hypothetical protein
MATSAYGYHHPARRKQKSLLCLRCDLPGASTEQVQTLHFTAKHQANPVFTDPIEKATLHAARWLFLVAFCGLFGASSHGKALHIGQKRADAI